MHRWYIRPGAPRVVYVVIGLLLAITSPIRAFDQPTTVGWILGVLGALIGLALLASVLISMRRDRRSGTPAV